MWSTTVKDTVRKLIHSKFYTKLVGSFLIILVFSTIFVVINNSISYYQSREQYQNQLQERLDASASVVGSQLMMAFRLGSSFFQEYPTIMYFKSDENRTIESQSEVWKVQELIKKDENAFNPLVHSVFTYYPTDKTILTSAGLYDKDFYYSSIASYGAFDEDFWDTNFATAGRRVVLAETDLMTRSGSVRVLPVVTVTRLSGNIVVHVCNLSSSYIAQLLAIHGVVGNTHLIIDNQNTPIYGQIELFPKNFLEGHPIPNSEILLSSTNDEIGLGFYELINKAWISKTLRKAYYPAITLVVFSLVGGFLLVIFFSLRLYRPISAMKTLMPHEEGKGRIDELFAIRTEMEELLSKEDQHQEQELGFQLEFARHSIHLLLHGIQPRELARTKAILEEQRGFLYSHYLCCSVLIEYLPAFYQEYSEAQQTVFKKSIPSLLRSFTLGQVPVLIVALEEVFFEFVLNIDTPDGKALVIQLLEEQSKDYTQNNHFYCLSFGVGNPVESLSDLAISHSQALTALQVRESTQTFQIKDFELLPPKKKVAFSFYDQKGIANNIETGNSEVLGKYILNLIEKNEQRCIEPENMSELYRQMLFVGRRSLEEHGYQVTDVERFVPLYTILAGKLSHEELKNLKGELRRLFVDIQKLVHKPISYPQKSCIQEIKNYLDTHYQEQISLEIISDKFGLSHKYLSRLFKEETDKNFSDYLVRIRVDQAKRLLSGTNKKIREISLAIGIESHATFYRMFQKAEGITPTEYRQLERNKQNSASN